MLEQKKFNCAMEVRLLGNVIDKNMFYKTISCRCEPFKKAQTKGVIIFCMSSHHFPLAVGIVLKKSGLLVRTKKRPEMANAVKIASALLDTFSNAILLVSHIAKRYLDAHSKTERYRARIFCYDSHKKLMITNFCGCYNQKQKYENKKRHKK